MEEDKVVGWLVFSAGMLIIILTAYQTYNIFTGNALVPQIVPEAQKSVTSSGSMELSQLISEQLGGLLPLESITQLLNYVIWTIGAGVLIFAGAQISGLGIKLIKKT